MAADPNELTIKNVETRKASLEKRARALEADLNALLGAVQDCEFWIAWLKGEIKPEPEEEIKLPEGVRIIGVEEIPGSAAEGQEGE